MKVFVVGTSIGYARFIKGHTLVDKIEDADVVIFTGGEDVTPSVYGCKKHPTTYCNPDRDKVEEKVFKQIKPNQLVVGICRGLRDLAHVKWGELFGKAVMPTRSQAKEETLWKVQRLGIETKFLLGKKEYVSNIPKRALLGRRYSLNYEEIRTHRTVR